MEIIELWCGIWIISLHLVSAINHPDYNRIGCTRMGKCFYVPLDQDLQKNWYRAKLHCEDDGMEMATIETKEQSDIISTYVTDSADEKKYWLGGKQTNMHIQPRWLLGDSKHEGEINDDMVDRDGEKCYAYESEDGNSLFAFYCYAAHGYICQRAGDYWVYSDLITWFVARERCHIHDMELATVMNDDSLLIPANVTIEPGMKYWIGLVDHAWTWIPHEHDDNTVAYDMAYTNWGPHQPSTSYEECVSVIRHGFWGDKECIDNNHILCQIVNDTVPTASPVSATESQTTYTEDDIRHTTALHTAMKTTKSMSTGTLAGIVSGVTLMLILTAVLLLIFVWRRKKRCSSDAQKTTTNVEEHTYNNVNIHEITRTNAYDNAPELTETVYNSVEHSSKQLPAEHVPNGNHVMSGDMYALPNKNRIKKLESSSGGQSLDAGTLGIAMNDNPFYHVS